MISCEILVTSAKFFVALGTRKAQFQTLGKEDTQEFEDWWEGHHHLCEANYLGTSGSMDSSGLLAIFQQSVQIYSVGSTEFLGDGDSKAHMLLVQKAV